MDDQEDKESGFQILDPEVDLKVPEEKPAGEKASAGAKATRARDEALPYESHDMPLREQLAIVIAFMALVYLLVVVFERSATYKYDPGTSHRPGVGESIVRSSNTGSKPSSAPWQ